MDTLTFKVPENIKEKLNVLAKRKGLNQSEIVRDALREYFSQDDVVKEGSFLDFAIDLAGSLTGEEDLSTNERYLDGYGK